MEPGMTEVEPLDRSSQGARATEKLAQAIRDHGGVPSSSKHHDGDPQSGRFARVPDQVGQTATMTTKWASQAGEKPIGMETIVGEDRSQSQRKKSWNTRNLGLRLLSDSAAAAAAGFLVAPIVTTIDKAIIQNASGGNTLGRSVRASLTDLVLRPHHFLTSRPFRLIFMVYSGTYLTANVLDTTFSTVQSTPASATTHGVSKFVATSSANLSLGLYKDAQFTKLFGAPGGPAGRVPLASFALFSLRDCLTIFASFNLPPLIAPRLPLDRLPSLEERISRISMAQFLAPAGIQVLSTPLHLMGLDLYNRPGAAFGARLVKVGREWGVSCLARMCRIIPAYGFGGVVNAGVRQRLMTQLE